MQVARLHSGQAAAPKKAPLSVKRAIWAANQLRSKPYRYGGGHKSFDDRGYDCSGTISYVLGAAGLISSPMSSTEFRRYGMRVKDTPLRLLPACDSIPRHGTTRATGGHRAGKPPSVCRAVSKRGIQSVCKSRPDNFSVGTRAN